MSEARVRIHNGLPDDELRAVRRHTRDLPGLSLIESAYPATNMLSQMTSDVRTMNVTADAMRTSLADPVRQDLVRLPAIARSELKQAISAHHARVARLVQMYTDMLAKRSK